MFVDPSLIRDKPRTINMLTPLVYLHLCQTKGFDTVNKEQCIKNVEQFTNQTILPVAPTLYYYGQGIISGAMVDSGQRETFDRTGYNAHYQEVLS